jgi:hypothetical protein
MHGTQTTMASRRRKPSLPAFAEDIVVIDVDNPYEVGPRKIQVAARTRDDFLRGLHSRGQIDQAQFEAGRLWQRYRELAEIGNVRGIDPTVEPVQGGPGFPEPLTDQQRKAVAKLVEARQELGRFGAELVESVLGRKLTITGAAAERGFISTRGVLFLGKRFGECLESLARLWGFVGGR